SYRFDNLSVNTTYRFGVRAHTTNGLVSAFASTTAATLADAPAPRSLTVYFSSASASWDAGRNPLDTRYEIRASSSNAFDGLADTATYVTGTSGSLAGLTPDTSYYFGVRAVNRAGKPSLWATL